MMKYSIGVDNASGKPSNLKCIDTNVVNGLWYCYRNRVYMQLSHLCTFHFVSEVNV